MSWDRYLSLSLRRRWVMNDELRDMVETKKGSGEDEDDEGSTSDPQPKRWMR
jgi:hypothetical protein